MEMIGFVGDFEVSDSAAGSARRPFLLWQSWHRCLLRAQRNADWEGLALPFSFAWGSLKIGPTRYWALLLLGIVMHTFCDFVRSTGLASPRNIPGIIKEPVAHDTQK